MLAPGPLTYESECSRLLRIARDIARRYGKDRIRYGDEVDGWDMALSGRPTPAGSEAGTTDLPAALGKRPALMLRRVYRLLRLLRIECGPGARIQAGDLVERWATAFPAVEINAGTVKQMLNRLRKKGVIFHTKDRGWVFESPQGTLFPARPDCRERAPLPRAEFVWVPGDLRNGVVVVADAVTGACVEVVVGWSARYMRFEDLKGRVQEFAAVRAELVAKEGRHLLVKLPTGDKVYTRALGDWHLAGQLSDRPDEHDEQE